jgi:protein gp37
MSLTKSKGNMYPWVTHTHSHLAGACPHACSYCYVQAMAKKFPSMQARYTGPIRLIEKELKVDYGIAKTIFIEHMNDLFADAVPTHIVVRILKHCAEFPGNTYVFQTKNPNRLAWIFGDRIPHDSIVGTTIESNRYYPDVMGSAPGVISRQLGMLNLRISKPDLKRFITIEPILDFDVKELLFGIFEIKPAFVNIGADSKGTGLPEPSAEKIRTLIAGFKARGIEIREKHNLSRLMK